MSIITSLSSLWTHYVCVCVYVFVVCVFLGGGWWGFPVSGWWREVFLQLRDHRRNKRDTAVFPNIPVDNLTSQMLQGLGTQWGSEREREARTVIVPESVNTQKPKQGAPLGNHVRTRLWQILKHISSPKVHASEYRLWRNMFIQTCSLNTPN